MNTYILLDSEEFELLQNDKDFKNVMQHSKLNLPVFSPKLNPNSERISKIERPPISEFPICNTEKIRFADIIEEKIPDSQKNLPKSKSFFRKSIFEIKDFFFPLKEANLKKIDEKEELISKKKNREIRNRIKQYSFKRGETYENSFEMMPLLKVNKFFLIPKKGQESLYWEFQKVFLEKNASINKIALWSLIVVSLIKLFLSLGIRSNFFINGYITFALVLLFLFLLLLNILFRGHILLKYQKKNYSALLLVLTLIYGILVLIIENHYVRNNFFDKLTLIHIMTINMVGSRLK